jgi:hypothetical protein
MCWFKRSLVDFPGPLIHWKRLSEIALRPVNRSKVIQGRRKTWMIDTEGLLLNR